MTTMNAHPITFALVDSSAGYEATPGKVRLGSLAEFSRDVEIFVRGSGKDIDPGELDVSIVQGSLGIQTAPIPIGSTLLADLQRLASGSLLDQVDRRRSDVIEKWQKLARSAKRIAVRITSEALEKPLMVNAETDYHSNKADQWVHVERYIRGEIQDLGGSTKPNAHVKLPDGSTLTVATDREMLRDERQNRLYKLAMLRITAKYNVVTGELADARLIEFVEYAPDATEDLSALRARGASAWSGIGQAAEWVDKQRGGDAD
jgi:hypothetical protein